MKLVEKSCQEFRGDGFSQLLEKIEKINRKKCPKGGLRYDIMVL